MIQDERKNKYNDIQGLKKQASELLNCAWEKGYTAGFNDGYATKREADKRPRGEWITVHYAREELNCPEKSMLDFVKCPFCETIHQGRHNFCSRCGADMKGGAE